MLATWVYFGPGGTYQEKQKYLKNLRQELFSDGVDSIIFSWDKEYYYLEVDEFGMTYYPIKL